MPIASSYQDCCSLIWQVPTDLAIAPLVKVYLQQRVTLVQLPRPCPEPTHLLHQPIATALTLGVVIHAQLNRRGQIAPTGVR